MAYSSAYQALNLALKSSESMRVLFVSSKFNVRIYALRSVYAGVAIVISKILADS